MKRNRSLLILSIIFALAAVVRLSTAQDPTQAQPISPDYFQVEMTNADKLRQEGSFRAARELYERLLISPGLLGNNEFNYPAQVWQADTLWRERIDRQDESEKKLRRLVEDLPANSRWRAEAAESLGDLLSEFHPWDKRDDMLENWLLAANYWGNATDTATARPRYIALNFKIAEGVIDRFGGVIPLPRTKRLIDIGILPPKPPDNEPWRADTASFALRNVLRVSENPVERTHALLLLGRQRVRNTNDDKTWNQEAEDYLKQAIAITPANEWSDDALYELAQLYNQRQRFVEAAETYKKFLAQYRKGESPFWEGAESQLKYIVDPQANLSGSEAYAPGSYLRFDLNYRNLSEARLVVRRVTPDALVASWKANENPNRQRNQQRLEGEKVYDQPITEMVDDGKHVPRNKTIWLEAMQPGIYQAEVVAPKVNAEEPQLLRTFLITKLGVAVKNDGLKTLVWTPDAESGKSTSATQVRIVYFYQPKNQPANWTPRWLEMTGATGSDGVVRLERAAPAGDEYPNARIYTLAIHDGHPAFSDQGWANVQQTVEGDKGQPVLYAYTDRPAYRPGDPINWKIILRFTDGKEYQLPRTERIYVSLHDARGNLIQEGPQSLDNYGTAKGTFTVDRTAALGVINIAVRDISRNQWSQGAQLCRIEEYKLPEFIVNVEPGKEQVKFGGAVPFTISAEYYFGGPVAGGELEVVVHRTGFRPRWRPYDPYGWFYEGDMTGGEFGMRARRGWGGDSWFPQEPEQIVLQKKLKLDGEGKARLEVGALTDEEIKNARDRGLWGYEYRVEARVVDASRREVTGNGSVKVARTAFAAYLNPQHYVYLPGDEVKIDLKTLDPNDQPVGAEGLVTIYSRKWDEEKKNAQGVKEPGYVDTKLFGKAAATDAKGEGLITFQPEKEGYYYIKFETRDRFGEDVGGDTTVMVCSTQSDAIGYRSGGVEIIIDKQTYKRGETAQAIIAVRRAGAHVWLGVEGEALFSEQVVPIEGTVKLVPIKLDQEMEPNVYLTAVSMFDYSGFRDTKMVRIPPTRRFLDVKVTTDKANYKPGEKTQVSIDIKDDEGKPVATQLSLGVADAAVWAIEGNLAPDIRQHFWGRQRGLQIGTQSSAERYSIVFWKPIPGKPGEYEIFRREEIANERYMNGREEIDRVSMTTAAFDSRSNGAVGGAMELGAANMPAQAMPPGAPMKEGRRADMSKSKNYFEDDEIERQKKAEAGAEPRVRSNFNATALWLADIVTDAGGHAAAEFTWPDSLTTWKAVARAADRETRVGQVTHEVKTNKPIMIRPQAPRFFIQGDQVTVSAIINNNTTEAQTIHVSMNQAGLAPLKYEANAEHGKSYDARLTSSTEPVFMPDYTEHEILVPANNQRRVDWMVAADAPGTATLTMTAIAPIDSDAAKKTYPVFEYGIEQFIAGGTTMRETSPTVEKVITLKIPEARRQGSESMTVWIEPTLARAMANALPYLADYPYGCVEQTLSRFVPAVIVDKTLQQLGIQNDDLKKKLPDMIKTGLDRLYDFQHEDGGWAWWKTGDSDPFMTAYVIDGLAQARDAGVEVKQDVIDRGAKFLAEKLVNLDDQPDMESFTLYALAMARNDGGHKEMVDAAYERLWPRREKLNPYTRALFALACHLTERTEWAQTLVRNMRNGIIEDKDNGTAHWGEAGVFWRWSEGGIEATAFSLRALLAIDPQNPLIDESMTWLTRNRRGNRWKSTRDTAIVIRALADYIKVRGEDKPDWTAEVRVNGELVKTLTVKPGEVFEFDGKVDVPVNLLKTGDNSVTITRRGTGVLYASGWLTFFTKEKEIPAAGNEVFIQRVYHKITNQPTLSGEYKEVREELKPGAELKSGERVEVELTIDAKNHYEYLVIEDLKAAGMEPVELQSGWDWNAGSSVSSHREFRDEKTAFFISYLPEGKHVLKYTLRAEVPGVFAALPAQIEAMYVPEIRGNSRGRQMTIIDK